MKPYKTLVSRADAEFIINKSRFIGHGKPVETEEEALAFLAEMRETYKDATHNCYAYIVGANMGVMRYSDDGEPGGTAGMPIIEVAQGARRHQLLRGGDALLWRRPPRRRRAGARLFARRGRGRERLRRRRDASHVAHPCGRAPTPCSVAWSFS